MAGMLEQNLEALRALHPPLYDALRSLPGDSGIEVVETPSGAPVPVAYPAGKPLPLHSRFDPVREAVRFVGQVDTERFDLFVVLGFAFAYHLEELLSRMGEDSLCLVIEKSAAMVREAAARRDLRGLLSDPRLIILVAPDEDAVAEALKGKASRTVSFITHRGSFSAEPEYYRNSLELARSYLSMKDVNIATLAKFERIWSSNIARNAPRMVTLPGANVFYGRFTGVPAIVAAAGPSLLERIDFIRENASRCVVVAVDTSFAVLQRHGIEPHFCVTVDPQVVNARYFEGTVPSAAVLVADPVVHPAAFRLFRGRAVTTGLAFRIMKWIEGICGERGEMTHGGSVATSAYDFAKRLGASPVVLVGQDLSFTGGYAHARGSYLDGEVRLRTGRLYREEMFNRFQLTALPRLMVRGIGGEMVHTNQKMMIFLSWFEKRRDAALVNATARGALIPGVRHAKPEELAFGEPPEDIRETVDRLYREAGGAIPVAAQREGLLSALTAMTAELDSLVPVLERAVRDSETLAGTVGSGGGDRNKVAYLLRRLDEADREVESKRAIKDIVSFSMQGVIHTITEGYDVEGENDSAADEERIARRSLYLYRGLLEGSRFTRRAFGKMELLLRGLPQ